MIAELTVVGVIYGIRNSRSCDIHFLAVQIHCYDIRPGPEDFQSDGNAVIGNNGIQNRSSPNLNIFLAAGPLDQSLFLQRSQVGGDCRRLRPSAEQMPGEELFGLS